MPYSSSLQSQLRPPGRTLPQVNLTLRIGNRNLCKGQVIWVAVLRLFSCMGLWKWSFGGKASAGSPVTLVRCHRPFIQIPVSGTGMIRMLLQGPGYALMLGALLGAVASSCGFLLLDAESPLGVDSPWDAHADWNPDSYDEHRRDQFLKSLSIAALVCAALGAAIGGAIWLILTSRPDRQVNPLLSIAAWWFLGVVAGLLLSIGFLMLPFMAPHMNVGRDGSGGPGVFLVLLVVGLSGIIVGSIAGISMGIWKVRVRRRQSSRTGG